MAYINHISIIDIIKISQFMNMETFLMLLVKFDIYKSIILSTTITQFTHWANCVIVVESVY